MKVIAHAAVVCLLVASTAKAATPKEEKSRALLRLMNSADIGVKMMDAMLPALKNLAPEVGEEFWTSFREEVKSDDLVELLVPIYAEHFEEADLDAMIRFFQTPAGQKFIQKQPLILDQTMAAGQKWGEQLALRAMRKIEEQKKKPKT